MVETSDIAGDSAPGARLPKAVYRLGWVSFLTDVSSEMIFPLVPAFLATLSGTPAAALGWIEGVADGTASILKVVSGKLADRAKAKKPLVLLGYGLSSLVRPLVALAAAWPVVLLVRFLDRVGKGIRTAPRDTLIAAAAPPGRRGAAFGLHRAFDNGGAIFGPLIAAGLLVVFGPAAFRTVFALAAFPALLSLAVLAFGVTETPAPGSTRVEAGRTRTDDVPLSPSFWRVVAIVAVFTLGASSDSFLLLKAREAGVTAALLPVVWSFVNAVRAGFSRWGGGLSDRLGRKTLLLIAWPLYAACYAAFAFASTPLLVTGILGVYALHAALSEGTERALVTDLVPPASRGRAFGWFHGLTGFASLIASVGFGWIWVRFGSRTAFLAGAIPAVVAAVALLLLVPKSAPVE